MSSREVAHIAPYRLRQTGQESVLKWKNITLNVDLLNEIYKFY